MATGTYYLSMKVNINCNPGGYSEIYNLIAGSGNSLPAYDGPATVVAKSILLQRVGLLEGNSKLANAVLSVEQIPGSNPPDGYEIAHSLGGVPILLKDPTTATLETNIGVAADPAQCISWSIQAPGGFSENRTLRSCRASWINQWGVLGPQITAWLNNPANFASYTTPATTIPGTVPSVNIGTFMGYLMTFTQLVQRVKAVPSGPVTSFNFVPYKVPSAVAPIVYNPTVKGLTRRKIGEGWPRIKGRSSSFASSS